MVEFTNVSSYSLVNFIEVNSSISTTGAISIYANFLQDVSNVYFKALIGIGTADQVYDLEFMNKTLNFCQF